MLNSNIFFYILRDSLKRTQRIRDSFSLKRMNTFAVNEEKGRLNCIISIDGHLPKLRYTCVGEKNTGVHCKEVKTNVGASPILPLLKRLNVQIWKKNLTQDVLLRSLQTVRGISVTASFNYVPIEE